MIEVLVIVIIACIPILAWLEHRRRQGEEERRRFTEWHDREARRVLDEKRKAQQSAHDANVAALAPFKSFLAHDGETCYNRRTYYPLFLWRFGSDLPVLRWKEGMQGVPLEEMTIVPNLDQEALDRRRLWIHSLPLGDEVRVVIRPACAPPISPSGWNTRARQGYVVLHMNSQCQITGMCK